MPVHTDAPMGSACPPTPAASRLPNKRSALRSLVQVKSELLPDAVVTGADGARANVLERPFKPVVTGKRKAPGSVRHEQHCR